MSNNLTDEGKSRALYNVIQEHLLNDERYHTDFVLLINRIHNDELVALGLDPKKISMYEFFRLRLNRQLSNEVDIYNMMQRVLENQQKENSNFPKESSLKAPPLCLECNGLGNDEFTGMMCFNCNGTGFL